MGETAIRAFSYGISPVIRRVTIGAVLLAGIQNASAFPLIDSSNEDQVPQGTELTTPDAQDLRHQLQLGNGLAAPPGGGWTIVPRVDVQEMFTDNALQAHAPRQYDLVTSIAPGIHLAGDMPRLQLTFDYAPVLSMYARTTSLNSLTQQMNGIGSVTVVPDLAFVDVRALAGVQNINGGIGGLGTIGASGAGSQVSTVSGLAGNTAGLNRNEDVQTTSVGISPYLLRQFGDWGTGKLGYSLGVTQSDRLTGFAASPLPSGGAGSQTLVTNEQIAHFATGEFLEPVQDGFDVDLLQSRSNTDNAIPSAAATPSSFSSTRAFVSDKVTWALNRAIAVFVSGGHEDIAYTQNSAQNVHDLTWSFGTTLTPDPDTSLTLSYGHLNGYNSISADGHYAVTARTTLTVSYGSTIGTQLENLQSQLNLATANSSGAIVNGQTGGQLYASNNALAVQSGVFRFDTLNAGVQTVLERDNLSLNLLQSKQTRASGGGLASTVTTVNSFNAQWVHQMRPDLTFSAAVSYSLQDGALGTGNSTSVAASAGLQYQISDTLSSSLRYSFFDRRSSAAAYSFTQNMLILGISKSF